jgi:hypothetical protein
MHKRACYGIIVGILAQSPEGFSIMGSRVPSLNGYVLQPRAYGNFELSLLESAVRTASYTYLSVAHELHK